MSQYKLMYFDARGRGEAIRMMFKLRGQEFEDYRFKEGEWPGKLKEDKSLFPLGQAPVLLIDGKPVPHSGAIKRHLAREFDFYGANNAESLQIDIICETLGDIASKMIPIVFGGKTEEEKAKAMDEFKEGASKPFLTFLNDEAKRRDSQFFVGNSETLADIEVHVMLDFIRSSFSEAFMKERYPDLMKFYEWFSDNSKLAGYIKSRP